MKRILPLLALLPGVALGAVSIHNVQILTDDDSGSTATYTAHSCSNRAVVFASGREKAATGGNTPNVTAGSWGSASISGGQMVLAVKGQRDTTNRPIAYIYYVLEANIPSGAQTVDFTVSETLSGDDNRIVAMTLCGVDQTSPVEAIVPTSGTAASIGSEQVWPGDDVTATLTNTITVTDGSAQVLVAAVEAANTSAPHEDWTEAADESGDSLYRLVAHTKTTETGASVPWSITFAANNSGTVAIASFKAAADDEFVCPAGKQCITLESIGEGSPIEMLNDEIDPDIAVGDIAICDTTTTPGAFAVTVSVSGHVSYEGDASRQYINCAFFDTSEEALHAEELDLWVNNQPPLPPDQRITYFVPLNEEMDPIDLSLLCSDYEEDDITVTAVDPLPTGLSIADNTLQGTATEQGITTDITFRCTDITGAYVDFE